MASPFGKNSMFKLRVLLTKVFDKNCCNSSTVITDRLITSYMSFHTIHLDQFKAFIKTSAELLTC